MGDLFLLCLLFYSLDLESLHVSVLLICHIAHVDVSTCRWAACGGGQPDRGRIGVDETSPVDPWSTLARVRRCGLPACMQIDKGLQGSVTRRVF